jgi:prophage maintenance system killer protein
MLSRRSANHVIHDSDVSKRVIMQILILFLALLQGLYHEASQQLTREDIKKQSAEIVAANTKNEDLVPLFGTTFRTKKRFGIRSGKMNKK